MSQRKKTLDGYVVIEYRADKPGTWTIVEYCPGMNEKQVTDRLAEIGRTETYGDCIAIELNGPTIQALNELWYYRKEHGPQSLYDKEMLR